MGYVRGRFEQRATRVRLAHREPGHGSHGSVDGRQTVRRVAGGARNSPRAARNGDGMVAQARQQPIDELVLVVDRYDRVLDPLVRIVPDVRSTPPEDAQKLEHWNDNPQPFSVSDGLDVDGPRCVSGQPADVVGIGGDDDATCACDHDMRVDDIRHSRRGQKRADGVGFGGLERNDLATAEEAA